MLARTEVVKLFGKLALREARWRNLKNYLQRFLQRKTTLREVLYALREKVRC